MESFGCLPSGIRCDIQDNKGRCVFLESPATAGEVVLCNTPVSYALLQSDMERRCSYCCVKSAALLRCGRCRCVMYCNAHCQKQGWKQHKAECKLLPGLVRAAHHSQDQTLLNIRLVLHTEAARKAGNSGCTCSGDDRRGNSSCGISHVDSLSVGSEFDYSAVRRASGPAASISKISASECEAMLARFDCNNFGILDELFSCVGAAVSPAVAMLNHSCRPNCILRYDLKQGSPPLIKVVACRAIRPGEELTHSYVEIVESRQTRQEKLLQSYGFRCGCVRCAAVGSCGGDSAAVDIEACYSSAASPESVLTEQSVSVPVVFAETGSYAYFLPSKVDSSPRRTSLCPETAGSGMIAGVSRNSFESKIRQSQHLVATALRSDNIGEEVMGLERARALCVDVSGPFDMARYQIDGHLLSAYIVQGNIEKAVECCLCVVGYLYFMFSTSCPSHPLLGLQFFTLGDLLRESTAPDSDVRHVYTRAREILSVTHGGYSDMVCRLNEVLGST